MKKLLLDTHVLLWMLSGSAVLGKSAREVIEAANTAGQVQVCAISFWEVAMLAERGRISLARTIWEWRRHVLDLGIREFDVCGETAIHAAQLQDCHGDPADRLIIASARKNSAMLLTADREILAWSGAVSRMDAKI